MRFLLIAASVVCFAASSRAEEKSLTVKEMANKVWARGEDSSVGGGLLGPLGLGKEKVQTKSVTVEEEKSPDGSEHTFDVSKDGLIVWTVSAGTDTPQGRYVDLYAFNVGRDGALLSAGEVAGYKGNKNKDRKALAKKAAQPRFKQELQFWKKWDWEKAATK